MVSRICILVFVLMIQSSICFAGLISNVQEDIIDSLLTRNNINILSVIGVIPLVEIRDENTIVQYHEKITSSLVRLKNYKYTVVVRSKKDIKKILLELKFQLSDLVNPQSAKKIGEFLGADAIVLGKLLSDGLMLQIVRVSDGKIIYSDNIGNKYLTKDILENQERKKRAFIRKNLPGTWSHSGRLFKIKSFGKGFKIIFHCDSRKKQGQIIKSEWDTGSLKWKVFFPEYKYKGGDSFYQLLGGKLISEATTTLFKMDLTDFNGSTLWVKYSFEHDSYWFSERYDKAESW
jgi:hypothetical protein